MTSDEQSALRAMLREEVNAAVYASEQRLGERMDRVAQQMDNLETTVASMGERMDRLEERMTRVEFVQKQMAVNLVQVASVLDEATIKINDIQKSQIALETKVEENTASLRRDIQKLNYTVRGFMDTVTDAIGGMGMRLDLHRNTPIEDAHPESAA